MQPTRPSYSLKYGLFSTKEISLSEDILKLILNYYLKIKSINHSSKAFLSSAFPDKIGKQCILKKKLYEKRYPKEKYNIHIYFNKTILSGMVLAHKMIKNPINNKTKNRVSMKSFFIKQGKENRTFEIGKCRLKNFKKNRNCFLNRNSKEKIHVEWNYSFDKKEFLYFASADDSCTSLSLFLYREKNMYETITLHASNIPAIEQRVIIIESDNDIVFLDKKSYLSLCNKPILKKFSIYSTLSWTGRKTAIVCRSHLNNIKNKDNHYPLLPSLEDQNDNITKVFKMLEDN